MGGQNHSHTVVAIVDSPSSYNVRHLEDVQGQIKVEAEVPKDQTCTGLKGVGSGMGRGYSKPGNVRSLNEWICRTRSGLGSLENPTAFLG